jgi:hypothetical protein
MSHEVGTARRGGPRRNSRGPSAITIVLILGGVSLLMGLVLCCGIAGVLIYQRGSVGGSAADLSEENAQRVQLGMSLSDVEKILGKGRIATASDYEDVNSRAARFRQPPVVQHRPGATKYVWRNGTTWFFGDFDSNNKLLGTQRCSSSR